MTQSFLNETSRGQHTELLAAFGLLFSKARRFYQYKAETASSGNLRRHFATLAELHQQILYLLPAPNSDCVVSEGMTALYELSALVCQQTQPYITIHFTAPTRSTTAITKNCDQKL